MNGLHGSPGRDGLIGREGGHCLHKGARVDTWRGAALRGVARQGEGAAVKVRRPRGGRCLGERHSSGEGLPEDPLADMSEIVNHIELKCLLSRGAEHVQGRSCDLAAGSLPLPQPD
jgi:hypothetical protein